MQMLKAKLYMLKQQENAEKISDIRGDVKEIGWGNQIRSYVLQPYTMVKDHRTGEESGNYRVVKMKWRRIPGKTGNAGNDKTTLIYNEDITITNIPLEAQEYVINKKSALDWIVERACVKTDKETGITNDFNKWGEEHGNPKYPLELFLRVITVSLETMKIVRALPPLDIHPLDREG